MDAYLRELSAELRRLRVPAARRRRILAEAEDHLRSHPQALIRFGDARAIAQQCADEVGGVAARRLSVTAFAVLAIVGVLFAAFLLAIFSAVPVRAILCCTSTAPARVLTLALLVVAPQVAFVSGVLAALRALRLRARTELPASEVHTLRRRTAVALIAGAAAMVALVLFVIENASVLPAWSAPATFTTFGVSIALLVFVTVPVAATSQIRVQGAGAAGDVFVDLGAAVPAPVRGHPWVFAILVALALALVVFAPGVAADDGYDAAIRGAAEALACLAGFALLGRYLGLRQ